MFFHQSVFPIYQRVVLLTSNCQTKKKKTSNAHTINHHVVLLLMLQGKIGSLSHKVKLFTTKSQAKLFEGITYCTTTC